MHVENFNYKKKKLVEFNYAIEGQNKFFSNIYYLNMFHRHFPEIIYIFFYMQLYVLHM